ncbi:MAG: nickel/cobalt transporter [Albidovulum sp.]
MAWAQTQPRGPFGLGAGRPAEAPTGITAWMLAKQAEFHRALVAALRQARAGEGAGLLITAGFLYGLLHAAGPGHGKAVVASYVFANEQALRRGIAISFVAAFIQAAIAIALVWIVLSLFAATARQVDAAVRWIEIGSFALIAGFGLYLTIRKARAFWQALRGGTTAAADCAECDRFRLTYRPSSVGAAAAPATDRPACGHVVIPDASDVTGRKSLGELGAIAFAAGSRPCTGAILILALARAGDIFPIGILAVIAMAFGTALATSGFALAAGGAKKLAGKAVGASERLRPLIAGLELVAAIAVMLLGVALLMGYLGGD